MQESDSKMLKHHADVLGGVFRLTLLGVILFNLCACEQVLHKRDAKILEDAADANRRQDYVTALTLYESALDDTTASAGTHFQMALICETKLHDPLAALFHFRRCARIDPTGPHAEEAKKSCLRLEPMVVSALSKENMLSKKDAVILKNENQKLNKELNEAKAKIAAAPRPTPDKNAKNVPPDPAAIEKSGGRTYTVEPGDTLEKISRKMYKSKARIRDLEDANINNLPNPRKLQVGQVLIIPK